MLLIARHADVEDVGDRGARQRVGGAGVEGGGGRGVHRAEAVEWPPAAIEHTSQQGVAHRQVAGTVTRAPRG